MIKKIRDFSNGSLRTIRHCANKLAARSISHANRCEYYWWDTSLWIHERYLWDVVWWFQERRIRPGVSEGKKIVPKSAKANLSLFLYWHSPLILTPPPQQNRRLLLLPSLYAPDMVHNTHLLQILFIDLGIGLSRTTFAPIIRRGRWRYQLHINVFS